MTYDNWKTQERLPCGCIGTCDPYAHDTAWDWQGEHDAIYPQRVHYEPYIIDEEYSGWVLYSEDDPEANQPLKKFSTLQDAKDWIDMENDGCGGLHQSLWT